MKQLGPWAVLGIWAGCCLGGALFASWQGYGGRAFAATLTCFAFLLLAMLLLAARGVAEGINAKFGAAGGVFLGVCVLLAYIFYLLGTESVSWARIAVVAGLVFVPVGLAVWAGNAAPGAWQDFATILGIWVAVKFGHRIWQLWPYPAGKLSHVLTVHGGGECGAGFVLADPARKGDRLFHRVGKTLGTVCCREFSGVCVHRHSAGHRVAFYRVCAPVGKMGRIRRTFAGDFAIHGMARRIAVSRTAAELSIEGFEERTGRDGGQRRCCSAFRISLIWDFPTGVT